MKTTKIQVLVERHEDGTYWGTTQNLPGVLSSFGSTLQELKENLQAAFDDYLELAVELEEKWAGEVGKMKGWEYKMKIPAFFDLIPEVKISAIAKKAGINESLMRQYARGQAAVSEERLEKIQHTVHELGKELISVSF